MHNLTKERLNLFATSTVRDERADAYRSQLWLSVGLTRTLVNRPWKLKRPNRFNFLLTNVHRI